MVSYFYIFLPLPKHSFEASLLGSSFLPIFVCMHWKPLVAFVLPCGSSFALHGGSPSSKPFGRKHVFWHALATHSCYFKMYPASAQNFSPSLRHTTNILFVTSWSAGALLERFEYRLGIVLGIVLRGLHLCQSYVRETGRIACRGLPKPG